jgi:glycosyltransferase involved in cell wall biosynthesis
MVQRPQARPPEPARPRVLVLVNTYPQLSETYKESERRALAERYDVLVVADKYPPTQIRNHGEFRQIRFLDSSLPKLAELVAEFRPTIVHAHYIHLAAMADRVAKMANTGFTIRTHSFDVLRLDKDLLRKWIGILNKPRCLGVLAFPFLRQRLLAAGLRESRLHDSFPVIDYKLFHDRGTNGDAIMNVGACLPKKRMNDFVDLAAAMPGTRFNLYPVSYDSEALRAYNDEHGSPVNVHDPVEPLEMPHEYKKHRWMVYTACPERKTVGWPLAVAEAQAAGVGVCLANVRPDLAQYLGGGGFLFDRIGDVQKIVSQPVPDEIREIGFEQARKSDVRQHIDVLERLWQRAFEQKAPRASAR